MAHPVHSATSGSCTSTTTPGTVLALMAQAGEDQSAGQRDGLSVPPKDLVVTKNLAPDEASTEDVDAIHADSSQAGASIDVNTEQISSPVENKDKATPLGEEPAPDSLGPGRRMQYSFHYCCPQCNKRVSHSAYIDERETHGVTERTAHSETTPPASALVDVAGKAPSIVEDQQAEVDAIDHDSDGSSDSDSSSVRRMRRLGLAAPTKRPKPPKGKVFVRYEHVYRDPLDREEILFRGVAYDSPPPVESRDLDKGKALFDVVTEFRSAVHYSSYERSEYYDRMLPRPPPIHGPSTMHVVIHSRAIIRALQHIVEYYPGLDLSKPAVKIDEPFAAIAHHHDQLHKYLESHGRQGMDVPEEETAEISEHLKRFLDFADQIIIPPVLEERERHKRGVVTWSMLWLLFTPGTDVAVSTTSSTKRGGIVERDGAVVETVKYVERGWDSDPFSESYVPRRDSRDSNGVDTLRIKLWNLRYDGFKLGRCSDRVNIGYFEGELELGRLSVVPMQHAASLKDGSNLRQHLEAQGKRYCGLLTSRIFTHDGNIMDYPFHHMEGQAMVDLRGYFDAFDHAKPELIESESRKAEGQGRYGRYDDILPGQAGNLDDHMYFLCPQTVACYMFKIRSWQLVDISNLKPPRFDEKIIDTLVMDGKRINLLKSLSKSFMRQDMNGMSHHPEPWSADFVKGKGNSRIFLLHGQPGVGKTYTAECIAEYARRPLMTLSTSDIGTTPSEVEENLEHHFKRAKSWGAILLIDEADVYLERRSVSDLRRNGLVAGFLRALEFYEGILFLTTNRVGAFDDAFVSRIHIKLHYPALSDSDRLRIWTNFIKKLEHERGSTMRVLREVRRYIEGGEIRQLELNGREIRNIFQTAVGLAEFECDKDEEGKIMMKEDHIAQVAEMSGEFKQYLDIVLEGDEDQRAERAFLRTSETPTRKDRTTANR